MKMLPVLFLLLYAHCGFANENVEKLKTVYLNFQPTYNGERLVTDSSGHFTCQDKPVIFETFKCYISHVVFLKNGKTVFKDNRTAYLLDVAIPGSLRPSFELPDSINYDQIGFCLGIDSAVNNAGVLDGCLSPLKGMYWTWQSGYINLKLEGTSPLIKASGHKFEFHIGGYSSPFETMQPVSVKVKMQRVISVQMDVFNFLKQIDLSVTNKVMSPGAEAARLSKMMIPLFYTMDED
jgi:hypothetical protein